MSVVSGPQDSRTLLGACAALLCAVSLAFPAHAAATTPDSPPAITASADVTPVVAAPEPLAPLIAIDPGHGGRYSNANANGLREKNVNLAIALALRDALEARGYRVIMTRTTDRAIELRDIPTWNWNSQYSLWSWARDHDTGYSPSIPEDDLQARVNFANQAGADLFISVHANGATSSRARGYETFASSRDALGLTVRSRVQREVIARTRLRDRGAQRADFYVLRWTNMPAFLVESAFITNPSDAYLLKQPWFRRRIASGIAVAVDAWMDSEPYRAVYPRITASGTADFAATLAVSQGAASGTAIVVPEDASAELAGVASLAAALDAPILFSGPSGPDTSTAAALSALSVNRVMTVGPTGTFDASATAAIAAAAHVTTSAVTEISADTRSRIAARLAFQTGIGASGLVFVADSADTTAALTAAPVAAANHAPLLLTDGGAHVPDAEAFLAANSASIKRVVLVGPSAALPDSAAAGHPISRYHSATPATLAYDLNRLFADSTARPVVADPSDGSAYLASAAHAARTNRTVLPISGRVLPIKTRLWITNRRLAVTGFEIHDPNGQLPALVDAMLAKADYY